MGLISSRFGHVVRWYTYSNPFPIPPKCSWFTMTRNRRVITPNGGACASFDHDPLVGSLCQYVVNCKWLSPSEFFSFASWVGGLETHLVDSVFPSRKNPWFLWGLSQPRGIHGMILHKKKTVQLSQKICWTGVKHYPFLHPIPTTQNKSGRLAKSLVFWCSIHFVLSKPKTSLGARCSSTLPVWRWHRSVLRRTVSWGMFVFNVSLVTNNCNKGYPKIYDMIYDIWHMIYDIWYMIWYLDWYEIWYAHDMSNTIIFGAV